MKIPDANGIVIDGFPRDVGQALSFEDQVSAFKNSSAVLQYLTASLSELLCVTVTPNGVSWSDWSSRVSEGNSASTLQSIIKKTSH